MEIHPFGCHRKLLKALCYKTAWEGMMPGELFVAGCCWLLCIAGALTGAGEAMSMAGGRGTLLQNHPR